MALLMVLLILTAVSIISLCFAARMDTELTCSGNTLLRTEIDQLAQSGLDHARGLILHPQIVQLAAPTFWVSGARGQRLVLDSPDCYDVWVVRDANQLNDYCTYRIGSKAYRLQGTDQTGQSRLVATLRVDPCIALTVLTNSTLWGGVSVYGDVNAPHGLVNNGIIHGDVFAPSPLGGTKPTGQLLAPQTLSLPWPPVKADYVNWQYYPPVSLTFPCAPNRIVRPPAGDLTIDKKMTVGGMLLVQGNLTLQGNAHNSQIGATGYLYLPALYVSGKLIVQGIDNLQIWGLVVVDGDVSISAANVTITGSAFIRGTLSGDSSTLTIVADPRRAAVLRAPDQYDLFGWTAWSPAAGAFYKDIGRPQ